MPQKGAEASDLMTGWVKAARASQLFFSCFILAAILTGSSIFIPFGLGEEIWGSGCLVTGAKSPGQHTEGPRLEPSFSHPLQWPVHRSLLSFQWRSLRKMSFLPFLAERHFQEAWASDGPSGQTKDTGGYLLGKVVTFSRELSPPEL